MSAFMVSPRHVGILTEAAITLGIYVDAPGGGRRQVTADDGDWIGDMLTRECRQSVRSRYPGAESNGGLPGYQPAPDDEYEHALFRPPGPPVPDVQVAKLLDGYEYQSCEHDGWHGSAAFDLVSAVRKRLLQRLPGYEASAWTV